MQITFIRHLPTPWNKRQLLQGKRDISISPVTEKLKSGIVQNQQGLGKIAPFDKVLASRLIRTRQTAHIYGYSPEEEPLLNELDFGMFEGKEKQQLLSRFGDTWLYSPESLVLGEPLTDFKSRISSFLDRYNSYPNILVFGHGSWIRACLSLKKYGHINQMNQVTVPYNACITISPFSESRQ